ncbi:calcium-responsive transcription factor-like [Acanthaster planci]|uniref:Calcium-responsive transcription factor-like n=1 Tax=Acanthaster planci TaxID=133434 RepID=A0A8B7ZM46_ACAPL|nr:calcium-responsive transcription factor-like [Acanthaster planci]XP_022105957.1 calcium-responsive transcription factor-like [Acanthaster planci]XP_022105958.1 calcium-responsive transcription factor-like [Acanthaster planci]XP_022105959.1 calcium-responsive transcription factor-like [Acanthaster planci]XP_022105960.1 calcium-responsive transcription factor-like [Acanthaster planci]
METDGVQMLCVNVTKQAEEDEQAHGVSGDEQVSLVVSETGTDVDSMVGAAVEEDTSQEGTSDDTLAKDESSASDGCHGDGQHELDECAAKQCDSVSDKPVVPLEIVKSPWAPEAEVIEIALNSDVGNKLSSVFHIVIDQPIPATRARNHGSEITPSSPQASIDGTVSTDSLSGQAVASQTPSRAVGCLPQPELREFPPNCPTWATRLKDCQEIGNSYRGYVDNEVELDLLLVYHRQQTGTTWGTRQSPSSSRESKRLMWKSNYVPYDGIPFLNLGSRAIVMECQYGPRRKGGPHKRPDNPKKASKEACTCPARIYVKKVRKFPAFRVNISPDLDKMTVKRNMDKMFQVMKDIGVDEIPGVERFYVQLPTNQAHQYHRTPEYQIRKDPVTLDSTAKSRLHPELCEKIQELVTNGEINAYVIRQILRAHVTRTMFCGASVPERHNLFYFPTINDIKNHVLLALAAIERGELEAVVPVTILDARAITEPPPSTMRSSQMGQPFSNQLWESSEVQDSPEIKPAPSRHQMWPADTSQPHTQSVTLTLTQNPDEGGSFISQVETQLSDGTTFISDSLTPETARLLSQINQHCQEVQESADDTLAMHQIVPCEQEEVDQSDSLLEEPKSITSGLNQSEEIIDTQKNDPTLNSQSDALIGLTVDASSEDDNDQPETLLPSEDDTAQSDTLLDSANTPLDQSQTLLGDATAVVAIDQSKHLLGSDPTAIGQSGPLLHDSDGFDQSNAELGPSASLESGTLLLRTGSELKDIEQDQPVSKRARFEV